MSFKIHLEQKGLSKSTIQTYQTEAFKFIAWCDTQNIEPEQISSADITAYLRHLQNKGQQNVTRSINLNILRHFFNWQIQTEVRENNPAQHLKIRGAKHKTLHQILTKQELESIYHSYQVPEQNHPKSKTNWFGNYKLSRQRNKAILSLMIYQGLCTDEVNRLSVKDVKLREGTIYIAGTRTSNERTLELKPHQVIDLMEYILQVRQQLLQLINPPTLQEEIKAIAPVESLFLPVPSAGKKTIQATETKNIWQKLSAEIKSTNKKFLNFQQVRTSVITHWIKEYNLRQVQYMAGHRYINSTEKYLNNQVEDLQSDIDKFHPIG